MEINNILVDKNYSYPFDYTGDYLTRISDLLHQYSNDVQNVTDTDINPNIKQDVKIICYRIIEIIRLYTFGHSHQAHVDFFSLMNDFKSVFLDEIFISSVKPNLNGLYKIQNIKRNTYSYSCKDNYIIPNTLYNLIGTNRFSIPGYPCLYLGSSSYICSLEVPKKSKNTQIISRYELWDGVLNNGLYLHYLPEEIYEIYNNPKFINQKKEIIRSYLRIMPLLLTIYHRVQKVEGPFRPEYILSQMLTQWVRLHDIHSICYYSTKVSNREIPKRLCLNFAFPAQTPDKNFVNVNEFMHKFYLTKPLLFSKDTIINNYKMFSNKLDFVDDHGRIVDEPKIRIGKRIYWSSIHGKLDKLLQNTKVYNCTDKEFATKKDIRFIEYQKKASWL